MKEIDAAILDAFRELRANGIPLGVGDLLEARRLGRALEWDRETASRTLSLLWASTPAERGRVVDALSPRMASFGQPKDRAAGSGTDHDEPRSWDEAASAPALAPHSSEPTRGQRPQPAPLRPPRDIEIGSTALPLEAYTPLTRRQMDYAFRSVRRRRPTGPKDLLDVEATIDEVARLGFFVGPRLRRRIEDQARLLLLIDRNGSMTPFHRLCELLAGTAHETFGDDHDRVRTFYFHNDGSEWVYRTPQLTGPISSLEVLRGIDAEWSVLIVSDAGAARGLTAVRARLVATSRLVRRVKERTSAAVWLNPMPTDRWAGTSADIVRHWIPMHSMDREGIGMTIDILRGADAGRTA